MASLRRSLHRWPGVQARFHVAVARTIVLVAGAWLTLWPSRPGRRGR